MNIWNKLAADWNISEHLEGMCTEASLEELNEKYIDMILAGKTRGRIIVNLSAE